MAKATKIPEPLTRLKRVLKGRGTLLIVLQDNPDPDAVGAAVALRELANRLGGLQCSIAHGGTIGRAENRALVRYLGLNLRPLEELDVSRFDLIAMVDTQPGTGNNSLPGAVQPDIVVDHHRLRRRTRAVTFTDVRARIGATSTILWEYLRQAEIRPAVPLATALLYGIRSDTQDLGRDTTSADIEALEQLYPLANKRMLSRIQLGQVPTAYFQMLADALAAAVVYGRCVVTVLGDVDNPDMIGEVADLLLRHEEVDWTLCWGYHDGAARVSLRTEDPAGRADEVMRRLVARLGTGGGHAAMAGGQVPLGEGTRERRGKIEQTLRKRFLGALGLADARGVRLVRGPKA